MKTIEMLPFCPKLCPVFTDEQRQYYMNEAKHMINNFQLCWGNGADEDGQEVPGVIVDKGHCLVVKVIAHPLDDIPVTVIPLKSEMEEWVIWEYTPRPIDCTNEYPYPSRFLPAKTAELKGWTKLAGYMHVILYTKEQLAKEGMEIESDYGMVTINAEYGLEETPMAPHSLIRNVDTKYGGNGKWVFNHDELAESFRFWANHIRIK